MREISDPFGFKCPYCEHVTPRYLDITSIMNRKKFVTCEHCHEIFTVWFDSEDEIYRSELP